MCFHVSACMINIVAFLRHLSRHASSRRLPRMNATSARTSRIQSRTTLRGTLSTHALRNPTMSKILSRIRTASLLRRSLMGSTSSRTVSGVGTSMIVTAIASLPRRIADQSSRRTSRKNLGDVFLRRRNARWLRLIGISWQRGLRHLPPRLRRKHHPPAQHNWQRRPGQRPRVPLPDAIPRLTLLMVLCNYLLLRMHIHLCLWLLYCYPCLVVWLAAPLTHSISEKLLQRLCKPFGTTLMSKIPRIIQMQPARRRH